MKLRKHRVVSICVLRYTKDSRWPLVCLHHVFWVWLFVESINQLQTAVQKFERDLEKLKSDNEDLTEKNRSLQAALDNSFK